MPLNEYGLSISKEILAAIGAVVVRQSGIELTLNHAITCLLGIHPQEGHLLAEGLGFRALCARFEALVLLRVSKSSEEFKACREIIRSFTGFNEFRNRVTHSFWGTSEDDESTGLIIRFSKPPPYSRLKTSDIASQINAASDAMRKLAPILESILARPPSRAY
jgi:hypothetical protein